MQGETRYAAVATAVPLAAAIAAVTPRRSALIAAAIAPSALRPALRQVRRGRVVGADKLLSPTRGLVLPEERSLLAVPHSMQRPRVGLL